MPIDNALQEKKDEHIADALNAKEYKAPGRGIQWKAPMISYIDIGSGIEQKIRSYAEIGQVVMGNGNFVLPNLSSQRSGGNENQPVTFANSDKGKPPMRNLFLILLLALILPGCATMKYNIKPTTETTLTKEDWPEIGERTTVYIGDAMLVQGETIRAF